MATATKTIVTAARDDLLTPFSIAERSVARVHHIDVLKWVRLTIDPEKDIAHFESSNGINVTRVRIENVEASTPIDVVVSKRLGQILRSMPAGPIQLEIDGGTLKVHGTVPGNASFELGMFAGDPIPLDSGQEVDWALTRDVQPNVVNALNEAAKFCSHDSGRQNIQSIHIIRKSSGIWHPRLIHAVRISG